MADEHVPDRTIFIGGSRAVNDDAGEDGFVLTEAIAALAIAGLVGAALVMTLATTHARSSEARLRDAALRQARFLIAEAQMAHASLPSSGSTAPPDRLAWTRAITHREEYSGVEVIAVDVSWRTLRKSGEAHLEAYRIAPAAPLP